MESLWQHKSILNGSPVLLKNRYLRLHICMSHRFAFHFYNFIFRPRDCWKYLSIHITANQREVDSFAQIISSAMKHGCQQPPLVQTGLVYSDRLHSARTSTVMLCDRKPKQYLGIQTKQNCSRRSKQQCEWEFAHCWAERKTIVWINWHCALISMCSRNFPWKKNKLYYQVLIFLSLCFHSQTLWF